MKYRIIQGRINYINNRRNGNELIRTVINELETNEGKWKTYTKKQCEKINVNQDFIQGKSKQEIRRIINDKDTEKWKQEMQEKKTLLYYRDKKKEIKQDVEYDNTRESDLWFRTKTNCLYLEDRKKDNKTCKICMNTPIEDLSHFLLHCEKLNEIRGESLQLQRPRMEDDFTTITTFLFDKSDEELKKSVIKKMWTKRRSLLLAMYNDINNIDAMDSTHLNDPYPSLR